MDSTFAAPYLQWGVLQISLTNALVILAMIVLFALALLLPFPHGDEQETAAPQTPGGSAASDHMQGAHRGNN